ncbi:Hsp20/alpha crystallin family protein [bacterium]|nr:Hsp20/alpha crystallin family protein [bacterium]
MAKEKRSFFERLTGAKKIEGDERNNKTMNIEMEDEETEIAMPAENALGASTEENLAESNEGQLTIDVYQTESDVVIKSTIAGVKPEDLDVSINNDMVTIKGERTSEEEVSEENYYYQECYWGGFSRSVVLPVDVVSEKAEASLKNGILTIRLPKASSNKAKKIQVRGF